MSSVVDLFQQIASNDFGYFQQVKSVADVLTPDPPTLTLDDTLESADETLKRYRYLHAPVLNPDDQSLVGIVSDRDILRFRPRLLGTAGELDNDRNALKVGVAQFMTRNPVTCTKSASPIEAISLMLDHHVDSVLVTEDGKQVDGIVTPRDFIRTLLIYHRVCTRDFGLRRLRLVDLDFCNGVPLDEIFSRGAQSVRDVMTKTVTAIAPGDTLAHAISVMQEQKIRHLPVTTPEDKVIGMLSDRDIVRYLPVPQNLPADDGTRFRSRLFATEDKGILQATAETVMTAKPQCVGPEMLLTEAMQHLESSDVSGLPVVDSQNHQLVGILTTSDVMRVFRVVMQLGELGQSASAETSR